MKKLQLCLSLVALAFATNVHADLGPWYIGYNDQNDVIAAIEVSNGDSTLHIYPSKTADQAEMKLFWSYTDDFNNITGSTAPWNAESLGIRTVVIDSGVVTLSNHAFSSMKNLKALYIPKTIKSIGPNFFNPSFDSACAIYCSCDTAIHMENSGPDDFDDAGLYKVRPYHISATLYVPSEAAKASFKDNTNAYTQWWTNFANILVGTTTSPASIVESDSITDTKATLSVPLFGATPAEQQNITYEVKITNQADPTDKHHFYVQFNTGENKWELQNITSSPAPRRYLPIIKRDTVRSTVETVQIDITGLNPGSSYNFSITATDSGSAVVSQSNGAFSTAPTITTGIEETTVDNNAVPTRFFNILGQPVEPTHKGLIITNTGQKLIRQ